MKNVGAKIGEDIGKRDHILNEKLPLVLFTNTKLVMFLDHHLQIQVARGVRVEETKNHQKDLEAAVGIDIQKPGRNQISPYLKIHLLNILKWNMIVLY